MRDYDGPLMAASRDASVVAMPNTRSPKKVHVAVNVHVLRGTFWEGEQLIGDAACNPGRAPLDMAVADKAETWPPGVRCLRRGCASRWPPYSGDRTRAAE